MSFSESNIYTESENEFFYFNPNQDESEQSITFEPLNQEPFQNVFEPRQFFISLNENLNEEEEDDSRYFISSSISKEITPDEEIHCEIKKNPFKKMIHLKNYYKTKQEEEEKLTQRGRQQ